MIFQTWSKQAFPQYCRNREKEKRGCVLWGKQGQKTSSSFSFAQYTAELRNTPLPEANVLTIEKQHASPGLLQTVRTRLCLFYRLEIKIQFNVWHLLSSQYIFSSWVLVLTGLGDVEMHAAYETHTLEPQLLKPDKTQTELLIMMHTFLFFSPLATVKLKSNVHLWLLQIYLWYFYFHLLFFNMNILDFSGFYNLIPLRSILCMGKSYIYHV